MQFFTVVEAIVIGSIIAVHEHGCAIEGCGSRASFYPWIAPFAVDLARGTYRSFTIHNEIIRSTDLEWRGPSQYETDRAEREVCAQGSELIITSGDEQLIVHVAEHGWLVEAELPSLARFIDTHISFGIQDVKLDSTHARALVAAVIKPPPAPTVAVPPPQPPIRVEVPTETCAVGPDGTAICVRTHR